MNTTNPPTVGKRASLKRAIETVNAIRKWQADNGYLPTTRQLADVLGIGTTATHARRLQAVKFGLLRKVNGHYIPVSDWRDKLREHPELLERYKRYLKLVQQY